MDAGELNDEQAAAALIDPGEFAALVREATDEQLAGGFAANRDLILGEIFRRMPERFDGRRAGDAEAVVEWRILERPDGAHDAYQVLVERGTCRVERGSVASPDVTFEVGPVDFVRLVTGNASGPKLFLFGRLKVRGNLLLAARMQSFFAIPGA